jgi:hypothetical protein
LNQRISGPNCNGKGRASPVITLLSFLLHWITPSDTSGYTFMFPLYF